MPERGKQPLSAGEMLWAVACFGAGLLALAILAGAFWFWAAARALRG